MTAKLTTSNTSDTEPAPPPAAPADPAAPDRPTEPGAPPGVAGEPAVSDPPKQEPSARELSRAAKLGYQLRQERKRQAQMAEQVTGRLAALEQGVQARDAELAKLREENERLRKDPLGAVDKPEEAIRDFVQKGTPEAETRAELARLRAELEQTRREAKEQQEREAKERERYVTQMSEATERQQIQGFVAAVMSKPSDYRYLTSVYTDAEIAGLAREVQQFAKSVQVRQPDGSVRTGASYSFEEVAKHLDDRARKVYEQKSERWKALLAEQADAGSGHRDSNGQVPGNGHRGSSNGPGTHAAPKAPPKSAQRALTREQQEAEDLAMLRKGIAADRAAMQRPTRHNGAAKS